ncbi:hypothetical protein OKHIL_76070 [Mycolicibacterium mageritense]
MTAVEVWLARAPRTRFRLLETIASRPGTMSNVAGRVTSTAYAPYYYRHLTALCDRGLVYERPDRMLVATAPGRNALSKARRVLRDSQRP